MSPCLSIVGPLNSVRVVLYLGLQTLQGQKLVSLHERTQAGVPLNVFQMLPHPSILRLLLPAMVGQDLANFLG